MPTSSTPFADFAEGLSGGLRPTALALSEVLDSMTVPGRLDPNELAATLERDPHDIEQILVKACAAGLLSVDEHRLCPSCRTPMRETTWRRQVAEDGEARCSADDVRIPEHAVRIRLWELAPEPLAAITERQANPRCALIMCALDLEREAVIAHLSGIAFEQRGAARHAVGRLAGVTTDWRVEVGVTGALNQAAAAVTAMAVTAARPDVAVFVGIAGGRKDVGRGDVAVADVVIDVSAGKEHGSGLTVRTDAHRPTQAALQAARQVVTERRWRQRIRRPSPDGTQPRAVIGPIAVSNRVIASTSGEINRAIDTHADRTIAVETEGIGFLSALYQVKEVDSLVVRGISDSRADKTAEADEDWQPAAADHAAAFAIEVLTVW